HRQTFLRPGAAAHRPDPGIPLEWYPDPAFDHGRGCFPDRPADAGAAQAYLVTGLDPATADRAAEVGQGFPVAAASSTFRRSPDQGAAERAGRWSRQLADRAGLSAAGGDLADPGAAALCREQRRSGADLFRPGHDRP